MESHALPPRYAAELPFPAYAFVPGKHPHPVSDPLGHSFGMTRSISEPLDPQHPESSVLFLHAIDLFNGGFYWEAHEAWEELWISAGRAGELANFLKGLIKLSAAGVKSREGQCVGVERHARRAVELFLTVRATGHHVYCGLDLEALIHDGRHLAERPQIHHASSFNNRNVIPILLTMTGNFAEQGGSR